MTTIAAPLARARWAGAILVCALIAGCSAPGKPSAKHASATVGHPVTGKPAVVETNQAITARSAAPKTKTQPQEADDRPKRRPKPAKQNTSSPRVARWAASAAAATAAPVGRTTEPKAAQTAGTGYLGASFDESGFVPPDAMGAMGPTQFLVAVNGRIKTFNRSNVTDGALNTTLDNFFSSVGGVTNRTSDPRVRYDRHSGRWFVTAIEIPTNAVNRIVLAVSAGSTILAGNTWSFFIIPADAGQFLDFDTLGVDKDALYIGANVFDAATETNFINSNAYVVRKSSVLGSGSIVFTKFAGLINTTTGSGPWSPAGVDNFDAGTNQGYFIGVDFAEFGKLTVRQVNNPGGTPSLSSNLAVTVPVTEVPAPVAQPAGYPTLDAGDDRLSNAVMRNGRLWTSHSIELNSAGVAQHLGGRDGVRWYELQNLGTTPALRQSGTIFDSSATTPFNYWMPSVMVSGQGHAALGFTQASSDAAAGSPSVATAGRLASDALGAIGAPILTGQGVPYQVTSKTPERWGDYSYTSLDPADDMTMWTVQEYGYAANDWGVRVQQLKAPAPTITSVTPGIAGVYSTFVTVNGTGFYDPGSGFPDHILGNAFSGGVVKAVSYISPAQIVLTLSTIGVSPGSNPLNITNPDGQSTGGSITLVASTPCANCVDFNADGKPDVLWHNTRTGQAAVWFMNGTQFVSSALPDPKSSASLEWVPVAAADFNADTKPDILWHNTKTGQVAVWFMDGTHLTGSAFLDPKSSASLEWVPVAAADFNADGKTDILWSNRNTGQIAVWTMNGTHYVSATVADRSAALEWLPVAAADFNADSKTDILFHNTRTGQIAVWFMDGMHFVSSALPDPKSSAALEWEPVGARDFNSDGKPDVLWHNTRTGQLAVWFLDGTHVIGSAIPDPKSSASLDWTPL